MFVGANKNTIRGIGAGLASGPTFQEGLSKGAQYAAQGGPLDDQEAIRQQQINETAEQKNKTIQTMLEAGREDLANMAEAGQMAQAWKLFAEAQQPTNGPDAPSSVREWEYYNSLSPEQQTQYLTMKRANPALNAGTQYVYGDPANPGQTTGVPIPIDNAGKARDTALGADEAEVASLAASWRSKMPGLTEVISQLNELGDVASYTWASQAWDEGMKQLGQAPSEGAVARTKYIAMVDNQVLPLLRDTFGAAFTVQEGESLRATLGDPNKHPEEKKAVLEAFIAQKVRDLEALESRLGGGSPLPPTAGGGSGGWTVIGVE